MESANLTDEEKLAQYNRYKRKKNRQVCYWMLVLIGLIGIGVILSIYEWNYRL